MLKRLCDGLVATNLISGFRATGLFPLDRDQVLKKLPGYDKHHDEVAQNAALNDSVMSLLRKHCGLDSNSKQSGRNRRGKKVTPGEAVTPTKLSDCQPSTSSNAATVPNFVLSPPASTLPVKGSASDELLVEVDEEWVCNECLEPWQADGDDRWIVRDDCEKQYHLQCSGVKYRKNNYYTLDIESLPFSCGECSEL